jgi:hypothetical protein
MMLSFYTSQQGATDDGHFLCLGPHGADTESDILPDQTRGMKRGRNKLR